MKRRSLYFFVVLICLVLCLHAADGRPKKSRKGLKSSATQDALPSVDNKRRTDAMKFYEDGIDLASKGNLKSAVAKIEKATELDPYNVEALHNLALLYRSQVDFERLRKTYKRVLELDRRLLPPTDIVETSTSAGGRRSKKVKYRAAVLFNLGCVEQEIGDEPLAQTAFTEAISEDKTFADSYFRLGTVQLSLGQANEAMETFKAGIKQDPKFAELYVNLGNVYLERGEKAKAAGVLKKAVKYSPTMGEAYINLASALNDIGETKEAVKAARKGVELRPQMAEAFYNLGQSLETADDEVVLPLLRGMPGFNESPSAQFAAVRAYEGALEKNPNYNDAFSSMFYLKDRVADWRTREQDFVRMKQIIFNSWKTGKKPINPFRCFQYSLSLEELRKISEAASRDEISKAMRTATLLGQTWKPRPKLELPPGSRLKIGYLSADFGAHTVASLIQGVFSKQRDTLLEVFCLATTPNDGSAWRVRIQNDCEHFIDLSGLSDEGVADRIRELGLAALIDLNGHSKGGRPGVLARQPAPLLYNFLGYPSTMGGLVDFLVSDPRATAVDFAHGFTEKLILLPHSYFVNSHRELYPSSRGMKMYSSSGRMMLEFLRNVEHFDNDTSASMSVDEVNRIRKEYGFPSRIDDTALEESNGQGIVFANLGQLYKVDGHLFDIWLDILADVPESVLWLLRFPKDAVLNVQKVLRERGMEKRVVFTHVLPVEEHISIKRIADIGLDTIGFNGHTTGADPLWAGIPMITMPQEKMASRVGASQAVALDIADKTVVRDIEEYKKKAVFLGTHPKGLRALQRELREKRSKAPFFDTSGWCQHFQRAMRIAIDGSASSEKRLHFIATERRNAASL